jgi:hypothetical protein
MYQYLNNGRVMHVPSGRELLPIDAELVQWMALGRVPAPTALVGRIDEAKGQIDDAAGSIVRDVVGDRGEEYRQAEDEARAWAAAGYAGSAPPMVASWAAASGLSARAACDSIIAQAQAWRGALAQIRAARLGCKAVAQAGDPARALAQWAAFEAAIRGAL